MKTLFKISLALLFFAGTFVTYGQDKFGGLALYTVRGDMSTNAKATLQAVADAGYKNIEAAGYKDGMYYNMMPAEFKKTVKAMGMKPVSTHQSSVTLDNADTEMTAAKAAGFKYFVVPIPPMGLFKFYQETKSMGMTGGPENLAKILTTLGIKARKYGLKLLYHNHDFEFKKDENGIVPIEYLLEHTDKKYVNFQMDIFWVTKAGADPVAYFEKYPGRFKSWHVKDMDDEGKFAPIGNGNIDFARILKHKKKSGMKYYYVEQDNSWDEKPLDVIKVSHKGLKKFGFK